MASFEAVRHSKVHPRFLETNCTSHVWSIGAIAELIDNAYDPDVRAANMLIDVEMIAGQPVLTFQDDGSGMDPDTLYRMMGFGHCEKNNTRGQEYAAVGMYGNGFKSGSMALGRDVVVFTKCKTSMSIGLLSQTFLKAVNLDEIKVPMTTYTLEGKVVSEDNEGVQSTTAICMFSPFKNVEAVLEQLAMIRGTGTRIVVYNLKRKSKKADHKYEFDFDEDPYDIRVAKFKKGNKSIRPKVERHMQPHSETIASDYSLRAYCEIMFLRPRMKISIRGKEVRSRMVSASLDEKKTITFNPRYATEPVRILFGIQPITNKARAAEYGMLIYHRNRLIKAFHRVGPQKSNRNEHGIGVVGVVEANFLKPTHNKQDFMATDEWRKFESSLGTKLNEYYRTTKEASINAGSVFPTSDSEDEDDYSDSEVGEIEDGDHGIASKTKRPASGPDAAVAGDVPPPTSTTTTTTTSSAAGGATTTTTTAVASSAAARSNGEPEIKEEQRFSIGTSRVSGEGSDGGVADGIVDAPMDPTVESDAALAAQLAEELARESLNLRRRSTREPAAPPAPTTTTTTSTASSRARPKRRAAAKATARSRRIVADDEESSDELEADYDEEEEDDDDDDEGVASGASGGGGGRGRGRASGRSASSRSRGSRANGASTNSRRGGSGSSASNRTSSSRKRSRAAADLDDSDGGSGDAPAAKVRKTSLSVRFRGKTHDMSAEDVKTVLDKYSKLISKLRPPKMPGLPEKPGLGDLINLDNKAFVDGWTEIVSGLMEEQEYKIAYREQVVRLLSAQDVAEVDYSDAVSDERILKRFKKMVDLAKGSSQ